MSLDSSRYHRRRRGPPNLNGAQIGFLWPMRFHMRTATLHLVENSAKDNEEEGRRSGLARGCRQTAILLAHKNHSKQSVSHSAEIKRGRKHMEGISTG